MRYQDLFAEYLNDLKNTLLEDEDYLPIAGYEGKYLITSAGRVISVQGKDPIVLQAWEHSTSKSVVELRAPDGSTRILSTEKLRKDHFDYVKPADSATYDYLMEVYGGHEECVEWITTVLENEITRRKP